MKKRLLQMFEKSGGTKHVIQYEEEDADGLGGKDDQNDKGKKKK